VSTTTTPAATPLLCRLNVHHKWRMEYPTEGPKYGWCIRCRKVNPTWSGWEWKDLLWVRFPAAAVLGPATHGPMGTAVATEATGVMAMEAATATVNEAATPRDHGVCVAPRGARAGSAKPGLLPV